MFFGRCGVCGEDQIGFKKPFLPGGFVCVTCALVPSDQPGAPILPSIRLADFEIEPTVLALIPREVGIKYGVIAINRAGTTLVVAMANPTLELVAALSELTGYSVEPVLTSAEEIVTAWHA